jgi:hypothetical protein
LWYSLNRQTDIVKMAPSQRETLICEMLFSLKILIDIVKKWYSLNTQIDYVNGPTRHTFLYIYSTIFSSTLHVSNDRVVRHQELIVVYRAV